MELIPGLPNEIARECLIRVPYKQFSTVSSVCKRWKEEIESTEFHQQRKAIGLSRSIVVLTQADSIRALGPAKFISIPAYQLTLYEPAAGQWSRLPPVPDYSDGLPMFCQCAGVGRYLIVIGGWNPTTWEISNAAYVYDFISATWHRGANMPGPPRSFFACASDSDRTVYVAGGHDEEKNALRSALAYDVVKDQWVPLPDMARPRDECKGVFYGCKFQVIGGYCTEFQGRFDKTVEAFDIQTWKWDQVEDMFDTSTCPRSCVADMYGKMYRCLDGHVVVQDGDMWRQVIELPAEVRVGSFVVTWRGKLLVIGATRCGTPMSSYVLELEKGYTWKEVEMPKGFNGSVQTGCSLEI